jgi:hypothetical protein
MTISLHLSSQTTRAIAGVLLGTWLSATGCGSNETANPFTNAGAGANAGGAAGSSAVACTPEAKGATPHTAGNYDNLSCNKANCHTGKIGGWVYASAKGYPWIGGATITITNPDGTTLKATSADDGFFDFGDTPKVSSAYKVCVSKCPRTDCNLTPHTNTDCLSSGCHALPTQRIYVTTPNIGGTGGTGGSSGQNCKQPVSGGPYVHLENVYSVTNLQPCTNCHAEPDYIGGFLYDGPTSAKTVAEATIVLTPASGSPVTTVTGPDGMFFFGTNGITTTVQTIPTPYTACVSKCPTAAVCSITNGHTTNADCGTCHNNSTTDKVYLR